MCTGKVYNTKSKERKQWKSAEKMHQLFSFFVYKFMGDNAKILLTVSYFMVYFPYSFL
jgi:hypothetical protein